MKRTIILKHNGEIKFVGSPPFDLPLKNIRKKRVSTITPMFTPKAQAFWLLRKIFGEDGRVAAWTRRWRGPWRVRILATGDWSVFDLRDDAVRWELEKLNEEAVDSWS